MLEGESEGNFVEVELLDFSEEKLPFYNGFGNGEFVKFEWNTKLLFAK